MGPSYSETNKKERKITAQNESFNIKSIVTGIQYSPRISPKHTITSQYMQCIPHPPLTPDTVCTATCTMDHSANACTTNIEKGRPKITDSQIIFPENDFISKTSIQKYLPANE